MHRSTKATENVFSDIDMVALDIDGTITDPDYLPKIVGLTIEEVFQEQKISAEYDSALFQKVFTENKGGGFDKYWRIYCGESGLNSEVTEALLPIFMAKAIENYEKVLGQIQRGERHDISFNIREGIREVLLFLQNQNPQKVVVTNAAEKIAFLNLQAAGIFTADQAKKAQEYESLTGEKPIFVDLVVCRAGPDQKEQYLQMSDHLVLIHPDHRKPSGVPYLAACEVTGSAPIRSMGLEDSDNGHLSLLNAGIGTRIHMSDDDIAQSKAVDKKDGFITQADCVYSGRGFCTETFMRVSLRHSNLLSSKPQIHNDSDEIFMLPA